MKSTPLLMTGGNVLAIIAGRKSQTRRVVKLTKRHVLGPKSGKMECDLNPDSWRVENMPVPPAVRCENLLVPIWHSEEKHLWDGTVQRVSCPYGWAGESRLWIRENGWQPPDNISAKDLRNGADTWPKYAYDADGISENEAADFKRWGWKRRPSIHMPRRASRLTLEIVSVRVERVQEISEEDAEAEGATSDHGTKWPDGDPGYAHDVYRRNFSKLWDSINGRPRKGKPDVSWKANPWVWVIEFRKLEGGSP